MPALDFALGLRMERRTANVIHFLVPQPFGQVAGYVARPVVTEQARLVSDHGLVAARRRKSQLNGVCHVLGPHGRAELPSNDIPAVIVQDRAEVIPAPADDLEVGEVGLPHLPRTPQPLSCFF